MKFVNQPSVYDEEQIEAKITPEEVEILYNPKDGNKYDVLYVGTIDFRDISNTVNKFSFAVDEKLGASVTDKEIKEFKAVVDMSHMSKKVLYEVPGKIVYLNMDDKYDYTIDFGGGNLNSIVLIGPEESLEKITADDIQIEVNVSSVNLSRSGGQVLEVSNISIQSDVNDCWVYGKYTASVTATEKE